MRKTYKKRSIEERFWEKVNVKGDDECWEWQACKLPKGYGQFEINYKVKQSHRVSWELHFGEIPNGLHVLHHCDNPSCVNPKHLFLGTNQDNRDDMVKKNRQAKGEQLPHTILSKDEVLKIRKLYDAKEYSMVELGEMFNTSTGNIKLIINRINWKHI